MADDLSSNRVFRELMDRVRRLETTIMLQNAAVTEGRLRFIGGLLRVDSGGRVEIVGTLQIDGTTNVTGSFNMTGTVDMQGNVTITGPLTVEGVWDLTGDGTIAGDVDLTGNMTIAAGGKLLAGGIEISEEDGGLIESLIQIHMRTPLLGVEGGIQVDQGAIFDGDVTMTSLIPIAQSEVPGSFIGAIMRDTSNRLRVVVGG
ncbi:hypothetical protein [Microbacterium sp. NPDC080220]|uniref:hypothetical protein n=1 Tax=Microbacterium sp. NPDC080220 TaxID=3161017 RepID=UPI00341CB98F